MRRASLAAAFSFWAAASAAAGCEAPTARKTPVLLASEDLEKLVLDERGPSAVVPDFGLPGGMALARIMTPNGDDAVRLTKRDTLTEGYRSAYVTTEVWGGFDQVWVQPVYVAASGLNADGTPKRLIGSATKWRPIFGVDPRSAFYSPYWVIIYFDVAPGDEVDNRVDTYRTVKDVLDRGHNFREGEGRVMAILPASVSPPLEEAASGLQKLGHPLDGNGFADGQPVHFLDFGAGTFRWDDYGVLEEAPIFVWVTHDKDGRAVALDIPTVAGTGPLYQQRPAAISDIPVASQPRYGSYWRIYTVEVPKGAAVFAPPKSHPDAAAALATTPHLQATYSTAVEGLESPEVEDLLGRVMLSPACAMGADLDAVNSEGGISLCNFVDSQEKIETLLTADSIRRTDIVVTCPFISYRNAAVVVAP